MNYPYHINWIYFLRKTNKFYVNRRSAWVRCRCCSERCRWWCLGGVELYRNSSSAVQCGCSGPVAVLTCWHMQSDICSSTRRQSLFINIKIIERQRERKKSYGANKYLCTLLGKGSLPLKLRDFSYFIVFISKLVVWFNFIILFNFVVTLEFYILGCLYFLNLQKGRFNDSFKLGNN